MKAVEPSSEMPTQAPPADPEDWTDEQWIEWLQKTDDPGAEDVAHPVTALNRIAHSSAGSVLGQAMLGMATAIYGRDDTKVVIVAEGPSRSEEDKPFSVHLDPEHPERSVVVFRSQGRDRPAGQDAHRDPE